MKLLFHSNITKKSGVALYVYDSYLECRKLANIFNCFLKVNGSTNLVNLNFTDNKASDNITSIYGGAIQYCQVEVKNQKFHGYQLLLNLTKISKDIISEYANDDTLKNSL